MDIEDDPLRNYRFGKILGHGSFGKVKIAKHLLTGHQVAIKILNRRKMNSTNMEEKVRREIKICRLFVHPHIIRLYEVIETPTDIYVVMEYVKSGELFDYIVEKGRLHEDEARKFFQQLISGLTYCHKNMVVHRDLKPENLLLDSRGGVKNLKIADFGLSNIMRDGHFLKTSCGSPNYAAPEVVSGKLYAGPEIDVWSCGVILYALLCGTLPFDDENIPNLFRKIKAGLYPRPSHLSTGARDLIPRMLEVDPLKRITMTEICQHPWFKVHLPRYLAVPLSNAMQDLRKLDDDIVREVIGIGFERSHLIESLQNRIQNDATVTYYLLLDRRLPVSTDYLRAEFQERLEVNHRGMNPNFDAQSSVRSTSPQDTCSNVLTKEKNWLVGLQCVAEPRDIMRQVLGALEKLNIRWKKIGHYNMKCLWLHKIQHPDSMTYSPNNTYQFIDDGSTMNGNGIWSETVVKFEIQLYKTGDDKYLLDLQRVCGPQFLFLDFCAIFAILLKSS